MEVAVDGRPSTMEEEKPTEAVPCILGDNREGCAHPVGLAHKQRASFTAGKLKLRGIEAPRGETGGSMLSVSGPDRFYYLRNFHDLRCKYARVLSVIR